MARKGEPRPKRKTLGDMLRKYTQKNNKCYDSNFDQKVRKLAPNWFISTVDKNKKQLLEMARQKKSRPHVLTNILCNYCNKNSKTYDPDFDRKIRQLAPHWFRAKARIPQRST